MSKRKATAISNNSANNEAQSDDENYQKKPCINYFQHLMLPLKKRELFTKPPPILYSHKNNIINDLHKIESKTSDNDEKYTLASIVLTGYYKLAVLQLLSEEDDVDVRNFSSYIAKKFCFMLAVFQDNAVNVYKQFLRALNVVSDVKIQDFDLNKYFQSRNVTTKSKNKSVFVENCLGFLSIFEHFPIVHFARFDETVNSAKINVSNVRTKEMVNLGLTERVYTGVKARLCKKILFYTSDDLSNTAIMNMLKPQTTLLKEHHPELVRKTQHSLNPTKCTTAYYLYETDKHGKLVEKKFTDDPQMADDEPDKFYLVEIDNMLMNVETENFFGTRSYISKLFIFDESKHPRIAKLYEDIQKRGETVLDESKHPHIENSNEDTQDMGENNIKAK